jgi:hypothetical protein
LTDELDVFFVEELFGLFDDELRTLVEDVLKVAAEVLLDLLEVVGTTTEVGFGPPAQTSCMAPISQ